MDACAQGAITMRDGTAAIDREACTGCGVCSEVCPAGAIGASGPVFAGPAETGDRTGPGGRYAPGVETGGHHVRNAHRARMVSPGVRQRGASGEGGGAMYYGRGFGFRGYSPPWPYVGRGRGGLPRCSYPGMAGAFPYLPGAVRYAAGPEREQELGLLKEEAEAMKRRLADVEVRIKEMEAKQN